MSVSKVIIRFAFPMYTLCIPLLLTTVFGYPAAPINGAAGEGTPISLEDLYTALRQQSQHMLEIQMKLMLLAVNNGDEFYNLKESLSPECQRTVHIITKMNLNLATLEETSEMLEDATWSTIDIIKSTKKYKHPVELLCEEIEAAFHSHPQLASTYSQLKKSYVGAAGTATKRKHYSSSVIKSDDDFLAAYSKLRKTPSFVTAVMQEVFYKQLESSEAFSGAYYVLARSIVQVAQIPEFTDRVERMREKVFSELALIIEKRTDTTTDISKLEALLASTIIGPMMEKFEKYFHEHADMGRELDSAKSTVQWNSGVTFNVAPNRPILFFCFVFTIISNNKLFFSLTVPLTALFSWSTAAAAAATATTAATVLL